MSSSIALKEDSKDYTGYGFNCFHIILYMPLLLRWLQALDCKSREVSSSLTQGSTVNKIFDFL